MSRRGRAAAIVEDEEAHHSLDIPEADTSDPVIGAIRFGMKSIMKIAKETVTHCPDDNGIMKQNLAEKMETSILQLVEAELTYSQTTSIVNQVVEELDLQDNPEIDTKEFLDSVESINQLSDQRIAEYKSTLSNNILKSHPAYIKMKKELDALLEQVDDHRAATDLADADTEPDEVDLDDSQMDDSDDFEVIPELDPVSKQKLVDPVRNRICRHIYGKAAMMQLIRKNPKTRCPALGCDNANIKVGDLIDDPRLTAKVTGQPMPSPSKSPAKKKTAKRGRRRR